MKTRRNLFKALIIIFLCISLTNKSSATDYVTVANGDASAGSTWSGGIAPQSFGGSGDNETTITISHNVYFDGDYDSPNSLATFSINTNCVLVTQVFKITGSGTTLVINGVLICFEVFQAAGVVIEGDGSIIAGKFNGNAPPETITSVTGVYIWTGTASSDWETESNWYDGNIPVTGSFVAIGPLPANPPVIDNTSISLGSVYIAISQSLTINPNASLTVDIANMYSKGILNIKSDATGTGCLLLNNNPVMSTDAEVNVERYLQGAAKWQIISSPVVGQQMGEFCAVNNLRTNPSEPSEYALAPYNVVADNWSPLTTAIITDEFVAGKGYSASSPAAGTVTFTGTSINIGEINYIPETSGNRWNSIGNPYTSAVLASGEGSFLDVNANVLDPAYLGLYVWDYSLNGNTGDYQVISNGGYTFPGPGGEDELNQTSIALGQGFVVKAKSTGGAISFTPSMQQLINNTPFKSAEKSDPALRLTVKSGTLENNTVVAFKNEATPGLDPGYDIGKLKGNANIALYTKLVDRSSDVDFAVQTLPEAAFELRVIPLGLDLKNGGEALFSLETSGFPENARVYLEDKVLNIRTLLNEKDAQYKVTLPETNGFGRFNLLVTDFNTDIISTTIGNNVKSELTVYSSGNSIFIKGNIESGAFVSVYGINGKVHYSGKTKTSGLNRIDASVIPSGIYFLRINQNNNWETHKLVLTKN